MDFIMQDSLYDTLLACVMDEHYRRLHYESAQCWTPARLKRPVISKKRKDKYGSVSAQSTSAIYGALRAPHYYAPSNMWYASIRSLNPRDLIYPYQWREDVTKEVFNPPVPSNCVCVARRRPPDAHIKQRHIPKCMYCIKSYNDCATPKKPDKKLEENGEKKTLPSSRMTGYRKCVSGQLKYGPHYKRDNRKSILECDVTAYDLIKKVVPPEIDDSDVDDNLSDNAIAKMNSKISQNSNYNESSSVLVCGQRIFTNNRPLTTPHENWDVCIPDPDYDDSDESDVETVIETKYRNPKFTYSPPPQRNSFENFGNKELSKSMSSLLSEEINHFKESEEIVPGDVPPVSSASPPNSRRLYESSSDSTLSSEYPTWTSNELKSILKKKRQEEQKKKQVQFLGTKFIEKTQESNSVINCDTYETIADNIPDDDPMKTLRSEGLPLIRSSSLENIQEKSERKRRLPKRRFSDLLFCPTKSSICGDDVPRSSRSLPDSPTELNPSFSFNFPSKEKVLSSSRSTFYVPVENFLTNNENEGSESLSASPPDTVVSPSTDRIQHVLANEQDNIIQEPKENISTDQYDTDEDNLENDYENLDPIYEELNDVSTSKLIGLTSLESNQKSFFEGASKIDILSYLKDAKERGLSEGISENVILEEDDNVLSGEEDGGEKQRLITKNDLNHKEVLLTIEEIQTESEDLLEEEETKIRISEVERNDSGVGTETSKPSRLKAADWEMCADCDHQVEPVKDANSGLLFSPLVCRKCEFRRCERKEIILEFVDTELKYGRDLRIIKEEFYRPMEIAGLLAKEQLFSIFLNLDELIAANAKFSEKLQDTLDIAMEHGDEDYTTVNLGKIFLECSSMMHAFETYCVKQASASVLLSGLEKEKELLRIFLRVSQMENTLLRRMNLPAFLMVPVQRVTRYPLLLSRLYKVTPIHHKDRAALKDAQQKVELHLEHINQQTKGVGGTKIWRRISNISASHRRLGKDIGSIKLRKMALEVLNWKQDETRFVIAGKLFLTPITDYPWNRKGKTIKFACVHALLIALGKPNSNYRPDNEHAILFPRNTGIRDASLVLMKEKNGRFLITRDPMYLGNCVISCESENDDVFEIQEYTTKDSYVIKGETKKETKEWLQMLRYHAKDLGSWRKRRNALANIMINGMIRQ